MSNDRFKEIPWPPIRNAILTGLRQHRPHTVYGTMEMDVTDTLNKLQECQRQARIAVSFHAFIIACVAAAAAKHPEVHRYRFRNKFVLFEDVDIATVIERRIPNQGRIPVQHIFRSANTKNFAQVNRELRETSKSDPALDPNVQMRRRAARFPGFVRRILSWRIRTNPLWLKKFHGTIGVTNLQRPGVHNAVFALPTNLFTMTLAVGSITPRFLPDAEDRPVLRRVLCLAVGADHAVIDGGDIARFGETLSTLISSGSGLDAFVEETRRLQALNK